MWLFTFKFIDKSAKHFNFFSKANHSLNVQWPVISMLSSNDLKYFYYCKDFYYTVLIENIKVLFWTQRCDETCLSINPGQEQGLFMYINRVYKIVTWELNQFRPMFARSLELSLILNVFIIEMVFNKQTKKGPVCMWGVCVCGDCNRCGRHCGPRSWSTYCLYAE